MPKPILNKIAKSLKKFVNAYIVDIPDENKEKFREHAEQLFVEALEHGAEGTARGLKS